MTLLPAQAISMSMRALLTVGSCALIIPSGHAGNGLGTISLNPAYGVSAAPRSGLQSGLRIPERSGIDLAWGWRDGIAAFVQLEQPGRHWTAAPITHGFTRAAPQDMQLARLGLRGSFGTLAVEQQWLPRVDTTATAAFHAPLHAMPAHTLSWTSPSRAGWSIGAAYAYGNRDWLYDTPREGRMYGAVSYRQGGLTLSGASNGAHDWNLLGSYTEGRNTWRLMLARFEGEDEPMLQFGLDHRYSRALTFFAAFQHEDDGVALTDLRRRQSGMDSGLRSGRGIMTGLRYDF